MSSHKCFDFFVQCLNPMITIINGSTRSKNKGNRDKPTKFNANNIYQENKNVPLNRSNTEAKVIQSGCKNSGSSKKYNCWFFKGSHKMSDCIALEGTPIEERRAFVKKNRLCFNCLSSNHNINQCPSKMSCKVTECGKSHLMFLDRERLSKSTANSTKTDADTQMPGIFNSTNQAASINSFLTEVPIIKKSVH